MDNSINFKGAFWLKAPTESIKKDILPTLGRYRQVFYNFTPEGDVLYITRKGADKNVAEFLKTLITNKAKDSEKIKFKYYPGLSTKSGFDDEKPEEARKILNGYKDKIITSIAGLNRIFKSKRPFFNFSTRKKDNTLEKCMQTLKLNSQDYDIKRFNGYNEIYTKDNEHKLVATISEPGELGFRYARLEPLVAGDEVQRYAVRAGEKFSYINNPDEKIKNGTSMFLKHFIESVQANRATRNVKHQ